MSKRNTSKPVFEINGPRRCDCSKQCTLIISGWTVEANGVRYGEHETSRAKALRMAKRAYYSEQRVRSSVSNGGEIPTHIQIRPKFIVFLEKLSQKGPIKFLGNGSDRATFLLPSGKTVVKIPLSSCAMTQQEREVAAYKRRKLPIAACRLLKNGAVMMRAVKTLTEAQGEKEVKKRDWNKLGYRLRDWCQVGFAANGKLVCFDAGLE